MFSQDLTGAMESGKPFRRNLDSGAEYSPLLGESDSDEESSGLKMPQYALQVVNQGIAGIPHPSTPPPPSPTPHTPTPAPPPPPPLLNMENAMKMRIIKGLWTEDLE